MHGPMCLCRPHAAMIAVVSQASQVTVYWYGMSGRGGRMSWQATATVRLGDMKGVPAADAFVSSAPGGKLHVAVVLHDYPRDDDGGPLEEHVVVCSIAELSAGYCFELNNVLLTCSR